jgi:hypothetical protein
MSRVLPYVLFSKGWVFVTGADSGMGEQCVYLPLIFITNYHCCF